MGAGVVATPTGAVFVMVAVPTFIRGVGGPNAPNAPGSKSLVAQVWGRMYKRVRTARNTLRTHEEKKLG
jgi:hypothetical protein